MPFDKNATNNFRIVNDHVELSESYIKSKSWSFKKITGSRFSSILGFSQYTTPFKIWLIMTNLYKDVMDPTLAYVGNTIEPKIREYVCKTLNQKYCVYNPKEVNWDVFKDNKFFGGIPDGEPINDSGKIDYSNNQRMLEIKTSSIDSFVYKNEGGCLTMQKDQNNVPIIKSANTKRDSWFVNQCICIPDEYKLQLGLYLYLRKQTKGVFAIGFLSAQDYAKPESFVVKQDDIKIVNVDYDLHQFQKYIDYAKQWYMDHILTGKSPTMTMEDKKWLEYELNR